MNILHCLVAAVVFFAGLAHAFEIIVPYPPGGTTDIIGRHISKILTDADLTNVVQNKPGAGGTLGTKLVANSTAKNSTLLILGTATGLYAPLMTDPAPYNVQEEFEMIATIASDSIVLIVPGTSRIVSVTDLVKKIKSSNTPLLYGHGSPSQKFAGAEFLNKINAVGTEVPFNGASPTVVATASELLDFAVVNYTEAKELATTGKIRIIGIASGIRHANDTSIKTFKEQGINFEAQAWFLLVAPKGVNPDIVDKLNHVVNTALKQDRTSYVATQMTPLINTTKGTKEFVAMQYKKYGPAIEKQRLESSK